ncbi:MAG: hypothetical protein AAF799_26980 [Myxococcota bacterium]
MSTGSSFAAPVSISDYPTDDADWDSPEYYQTLAMTDVDDDGELEVCGRASDGIRCSR